MNRPLTPARAAFLFTMVLLTLLLAGCGTIGPTNPDGEVAAVEVAGTARVKVGDQYQFTAKPKLANGTVVQRPITWGVVQAHKGAVDPTGRFMASQGGSVTLTATAEGVTGTAPLTAYDWQQTIDGPVIVLRLAADSAIVNRHNVSAYPELIVGCSANIFFVAVAASHVQLAHGNVSFAFGNGAVQNGTWLATDAGGLLFPGNSNALHKQFANTIAASSTFRIAFNEAQGGPQLAKFRVSGLASRLPVLMQACT